jgi:MoaA/NifB/PqqE/SkfB family radical SAM enzyme
MVPVTGTVPREPPVRAVLKLTYACNQRCAFCRVDECRGTVDDVPAETVVRKALAARALGVDMILFSGGEPTLRSDLPRLAAAMGAIGMSWGLITNGRRLAHEAFREVLLGLGLTYVHTSLHGATAATHDDLVECAAFDEVLAALRGLQGRGVELHVNTVVTRSNVGEIAAIGDLLAGIGPMTHKVCLAEPRGRFLERAEALWVAPEEAGRAAEDAVRKGRERDGLNVVVEGFPLCQVPSARDSVSGLHGHNIRYISEGFEDGFFPADAGERTYLSPCERCTARGDCPGVYVGYAERCGTTGLKAFEADGNG